MASFSASAAIFSSSSTKAPSFGSLDVVNGSVSAKSSFEDVKVGGHSGAQAAHVMAGSRDRRAALGEELVEAGLVVGADVRMEFRADDEPLVQPGEKQPVPIDQSLERAAKRSCRGLEALEEPRSHVVSTVMATNGPALNSGVLDRQCIKRALHNGALQGSVPTASTS